MPHSKQRPRKFVLGSSEVHGTDVGGGTAKRGPRRIAIVSSSRLFRDGLRGVLERADRIITEDYERLTSAASRLAFPPDLFIVGIGAGARVQDVINDIQAMRAQIPSALWLVISQTSDRAILRSVASCADGLLLENASAEMLRIAVDMLFLDYAMMPTSLIPRETASYEGAGRQLDDVTTAARPARFGHDTRATIRSPFGATPKVGGPAADPAPIVQPMGQAEAPASQSSRDELPAAFESGPSRPRPAVGVRPMDRLSEREREILRCLVAGHSNKLIARELNIAEATVKVHVKGLLRKMQVANRTQAAISAVMSEQQDKAPKADNLVELPSNVASVYPLIARRASTQ